MFKKKATLAIVMATLIVLVAPLAVDLSADIWTCADAPSYCNNTLARGCSGDVMYFSGCRLYCKTGSTTTPATSCYYHVVIDDVTASQTETH